MVSSSQINPVSEKDYQEYLEREAECINNINHARQLLETLRKETYTFDVHRNTAWHEETIHAVDEIRHYLRTVNASLADVGTDEKELSTLMRLGYKNEASYRLELARLCESSGYVKDVDEAIFCFGRSPNIRSLKNLLQVVLLIQPYHDARKEITEMLRLLEEAKIPLFEIGAYKKELSRLRYPFFLRYLL